MTSMLEVKEGVVPLLKGIQERGLLHNPSMLQGTCDKWTGTTQRVDPEDLRPMHCR